MTNQGSIVPTEQIENAILIVRGQKVMLDADLAAMYGVTTARLNEQVRRNPDRFPGDFAFQLTAQEVTILMSQNAISSFGHGGRRANPWAFTEQGVAMLSSVLRSPQAVRVNVEIMRAFVRLRQSLAMNVELARRLDDLEKRVSKHDKDFLVVIQAIRDLMETPPTQETADRFSYSQRVAILRSQSQQTKKSVNCETSWSPVLGHPPGANSQIFKYNRRIPSTPLALNARPKLALEQFDWPVSDVSQVVSPDI